MDDDGRDEGIDDRLDGRVRPVGRALRATFPPDNHDSLTNDLTGLMIDLSRIPFDESDQIAPLPPIPFAGPPIALPDHAQQAGRLGVMARLAALFLQR